MDLTALSAYSSLAAAIGQVASAVAVAVSLLTLQLRQNTRAVQAQMFISVLTKQHFRYQRALPAPGVHRIGR